MNEDFLEKDSVEEKKNCLKNTYYLHKSVNLLLITQPQTEQYFSICHKVLCEVL